MATDRSRNGGAAFRPLTAFLAALVLCAGLYWPALHGDFFFDDYPNIVENPDVQVTTTALRDWVTAALSSPSSELRRPIPMLSFAANEFFSGNRPFPMEVVNLFVHLTNGVLLLLVMGEVLRAWNRGREMPVPEGRLAWTAVAVSGLWLLLPINLTTVVYIVQRMESLAQLFVLLGLWLYLRSRRQQLAGRGGALAGAIALLACTIGGLCCKETAILLPAYAFLAEAVLLHFEVPPGRDRRGLHGVFALLLWLPAALGSAWLLHRLLTIDLFAGRSFTLGQRLLTEARIVTDYIGWTLLPLPNALSFYHDDIRISTSLLDPPQTLLCLALLFGLAATAWRLRRRNPLFCLGLSWFFAAQALTATVLPLELVFEHRNYFSSIGLLLAAAGVLWSLPPPLRILRTAVPLAAGVLFCLVTGLRAEEWSNPLRLAWAEAGKHPQSPRATYGLGRLLVIASGNRADSPLVPEAIRVLESSSALPDGGTLPDAALIVLATRTHRPVDPEWWTRLTAKLAAHPASQEDISALQSLVNCETSGECTNDTQQLLTAFLAALQHPAPLPRLLGMYSDFAVERLHDDALAERLLTEAVARSDRPDVYRISLAQVLILEGRNEQALAVLDQLHLADLNTRDLARIGRLRQLACVSGSPCPQARVLTPPRPPDPEPSASVGYHR